MTLEIRRPGSKMLTSHRLPEIINEIGIGWYHIISFVILVCMPLAEGAGMIVAGPSLRMKFCADDDSLNEYNE